MASTEETKAQSDEQIPQRPARAAATRPPKPQDSPADDESPEERSARGAAAKQSGPVTLVVKHGTYTGPGCPDPNKRKLEKDQGFHYDHDHPAQVGEHIVGVDKARAKRMLEGKCFETLEQAQLRAQAAD